MRKSVATEAEASNLTDRVLAKLSLVRVARIRAAVRDQVQQTHHLIDERLIEEGVDPKEIGSEAVRLVTREHGRLAGIDDLARTVRSLTTVDIR